MNIRVSAGALTERSLEIIRDLKHLEGPMLPIQHAKHADLGYVPDDV